jgi:hypothetical protein
MAKAFIKFANNSNTEKLIITWAEFASPLSEIGRQVYDPPHPQRALTVDDLRPVLHQFAFWKSSDGVTKDLMLITLDIDLSSGNTQTVWYEYEVGRGEQGDPIQDDVTLTDPRLAGVVDFYVERRGVGKLKSTEYTKDLVAGSFTLSTDVFYDEDTYFVVVSEAASGVGSTPGTASSGEFEEVIEITAAETTYNSNHFAKLLVISTAQTVAAMTFPSGIPRSKVRIATHAGTQRYVRLNFASPVMFFGQAKDYIYLGQGESIEILCTGSNYYVSNYCGDYGRLGSFVWGKKVLPNTMQLNGQQHSKILLGRLWLDHVITLSAGMTTDMATWASEVLVDGVLETPHKGLFGVSIADVRLPDFTNRSIRAMGASNRVPNVPGGFQIDDNRAHVHGLPIRNDNTAYGFGTKTIPSRKLEDISSGHNSVNVIHISDSNGSQSTPRNIGLIPLIYI